MLFKRIVHAVTTSLVILAITAMQRAEAIDYYYFCPKGDARFGGTDNSISGVAVTPYPTGPGQLLSNQIHISKRLLWQLTSCSNKEFLCLDVTDLKNRTVRRLFVPRIVEVGSSYRYGPAKAYVIGSAALEMRDTAQIIISQEVRGRTIAVKLTLRNNRGAIFIDGINFWDPWDFMSGETCALESTLGYFHGVKIKPNDQLAPIPE